MIELVVRGGRTIETGGSGSSRLSAPVDVGIAGGRIVALGEEVDAPDAAVLDAAGCVLAPGLVNGHTHSHELLHRGRSRKLPLEVWMHGPRPPFPIQPLSAEEVYTRTIVAGLEQLRGGATTIVDDVAFPGLDRTCIEAAFRAYDDLGARAYVGVSLLNRPYARAMPFADEELPASLGTTPPATTDARGAASRPADDLCATSPAATDDLLGLVRDLLGARSDSRVRFIVAPSAPQRCSDRLLVEAVGLAREAGAPAIMHVHETRLQAVTGQRWYGATMIEHLHELGVLGPGLSLIHGVWLTPRDVDLLAASNTTVQHNPVSNLRLGSGLAPVRAMLDAGVNVSLGTDGCGSCVTASTIDGVRQAALLHALRGDDPSTWVDAGEALTMATTAAARALLRDDLGRLEVGCRADLLCVRLDGPSFVPLNDPLRQLVHGAAAARIDTVVVDGRPVLAGGRVLTVDEPAALEAARELHRERAPELDRLDALVAGIQPAYLRIHHRCLAEPISPETYSARLSER